ncbi:MAG: methylglyoxal synthase [Ruminiclostridium sp.]|jgi:methylglyoxal synthase|nr:methylglyoxal synthase [Ruminiclostridium sp.]
MNIAFIAHDNKKELMEAFCIAYKYILKDHILFATSGTGSLLSEATGLEVNCLEYGHLGEEQIAARVAYNEMDLVIFFLSPTKDEHKLEGFNTIRAYCDQHNIPFATNLATAEILINGLQRGDFAWRELVNPSSSK